jgi:hypothetical protein
LQNSYRLNTPDEKINKAASASLASCSAFGLTRLSHLDISAGIEKYPTDHQR